MTAITWHAFGVYRDLILYYVATGGLEPVRPLGKHVVQLQLTMSCSRAKIRHILAPDTCYGQ
jgi:hypothetical protein